jgi:demethylspheroidene O-methyltransferase
LRAGVALRLIEPLGDGRYALGADGAALLGQPGMLDMIAHHAILYDDLADPLQLLRTSAGEGLSGYWAYAKEGGAPVLTEEQAARYSALMAATAPGVAAEVLASVSFRGVREVLDIGGGEGVFLSAVGKRWPRVRLRLMDLPAVMPRAQARLAPFGERVAFSPGNFLTDSPPAGADLITLVRVLHDQDEAGAMRLLRAAHAAAPKGGRLLIAEPMSAAPAPDRVSDAYFGLYFLAMGRGEARTPAVISAMAQEAGWRAPREVRTRHPALLRVLIADA